MTGHQTQTGGPLERLRRIGESLLALARSRTELMAVELQEEKLRLLSLLVWFGVALTFAVGGLLVAIGALAIWSWETAGYLGLAALSAATLAAGAALFWGIRRKILLGPSPFAETIEEFRRDTACLRTDN